MQKPRYPLDQIFQILDRNDSDRIWFSAPSRSINQVMKVYSKTEVPKSVREAKEWIKSGIRTLKEENFVRSLLQWNDPNCIADEYGLIFDEKSWYVKFRIDEDGDLDEISFHPPERDMKTISGIVIPKGKNYED